MKHLFLFFLIAFIFSASAHAIEPKIDYKPETLFTITVQFPDYNCTGTRAIWQQLYSDLDAVFAIFGANMAIVEAIAHSFETVNGIPMCQCRYQKTLYHINIWAQANLGTTVQPIQGCVVHPAVLVGNPDEDTQVVIKIDNLI